MRKIQLILYGFSGALIALAAITLFAPYADAATVFSQQNTSQTSSNHIPSSSGPYEFFDWTPSVSGAYDEFTYVHLTNTGGNSCVIGGGYSINGGSQVSSFFITVPPNSSGWLAGTAGSPFSYSSGDVITVNLADESTCNTVYLDGTSTVIPTTSTYNWASSLGTPAIQIGGNIPNTIASNTTGIDSITEPTLAATTSSPVLISFQYTISSSTMPVSDDRAYSEYRLVFTQPSTGAVITAFGALDNDSFGAFVQSTTTSLNGDGTWNLSVSLATPVQFGTRSYAPRGAQTFFGLSFNDRPDVYASYLPPQQSAYASSSCAISFAGTFDLPQCLGYLIVPTVGSSSPLNEIRNLSLKNTMPFAYIYQLGDIREALFNSSSTASTTISIPVSGFGHGTSTITFLSAAMIESLPFTGTFRTIFGFLLWFMLAELIYYQVIRAHDTTTPSV